MTAFSPGLVLGCFELLEMADRRELQVARVASEFSKIGVMPAAKVVELAENLNWLRAGDDGRAVVTPEGRRILSCGGYEGRVRRALLDYIEVVRPPWVQNATFGRAKVIGFAGSQITQVFVEAGLAHGTDRAAIDFWDELAARARGQKGLSLNATGRQGERLTIEYERQRTQREPRWVSIDSSEDGYDVLSVSGPTDGRLLKIEVKATRIGMAGTFHLTANEWEQSVGSDRHAFHLWDLSPPAPALAVLSRGDIEPHVPADRGVGRWESVEIPFGPYSGMFLSLSSDSRG